MVHHRERIARDPVAPRGATLPRPPPSHGSQRGLSTIRTARDCAAAGAAAVVLAVAAPAPAQNVADHPRVAEALRVVVVWIEGMRAYAQIPGISAAVVHDQETIWAGAHGLANPDRRLPATPGRRDTRPYMPEELWGEALATGFGAPGREGERRPLPFFHARGIAPAAGFSSNALDLARFAAWQFRLRGDTEEVLRAHTLHEMQRVHYVDPSFETYRGLGFGVYRMDGTTFVGHGGSCPGHQTQLFLQMDDRIATVFMANAGGVNTARYARGMYALVAPAAPDLDRYLGSYDYFPWGGEAAVVRWKGGLAFLYLPTDDPVGALTQLEHVEGHTFRRVRDDDRPGETVRFGVDAQGRATALVRYENRYPRIR